MSRVLVLALALSPLGAPAHAVSPYAAIPDAIGAAQLDAVRLGLDCDRMSKTSDEGAWSTWQLTAADPLVVCLMAQAGTGRSPAMCRRGAGAIPDVDFEGCTAQAASLAAHIDALRTSIAKDQAAASEDPARQRELDAVLNALDASHRLPVRIKSGKVRPTSVEVHFLGRANAAEKMWVASVAQALRHGTARGQRVPRLEGPPPPVEFTLAYAASPGCLPVGARVGDTRSDRLPTFDDVGAAFDGGCPDEGPMTITLPPVQLVAGALLSLPGNGLLEVIR